MNGRVQPPRLVDFIFHKRVPVGTPPHLPPGPNRKQVLVVENEMPSWGRLKSYELTVLRDGNPAFDMHTYSFGVEPKLPGEWTVTFQIWDVHVDTIVNHEYDVTAQIHYWPE